MLLSIIKENKKDILEILISSVIFIFAFLFRNTAFVGLLLFLISYLIAARIILWKAIKNLIHGKVFDENFLMTIATGGAFAIREYPEAVLVMLFYRIGELLEDMAIDRSRHSITSLLNIRADHANIKEHGTIKRVLPEEVKVGDTIVVKPGERVPLDGFIIEGESFVDTSALTGESRPRFFRKQDEILSGMINSTGVLTIKVTKELAESTVSKILNLVENARGRKSPTERFISKFAKYYTPAVVFLAISLAVIPSILYRIPFTSSLFSQEVIFSDWLYRALVFLVISCPCALVISIPLGFFGGIGAASRRGILVKGSNFLEGLNNLKTIIFDKTGTLTKGIFKVSDVVPCDGFSKEEILRLAAEAEGHSNHPIAKSIIEAYGKEIDECLIEEYEEITGFGVKAIVEGRKILAGNDKLLHRENIPHENCFIEGTVVNIAVDGKHVGYIVISDEIKEDAKETIENLRGDGISKQIMLTGDSEDIARTVSKKIGLDGFHAELLPHKKVEMIEKLVAGKENKTDRIAFVGDGINDAPVIARSDIGIAMGALGSDAAIEAADIVLMTDELSKIHEAMKIARRTRKIVWQNIILALLIKFGFLSLATFGAATMWEALFADMGVAIIAILNASRALRLSGK